MTISDFAIRRPVITVVTMLALVVFGLVSLYLLQTDEFPDVAVPLVVVSVPYPGASPDNVEHELVDPVEEALAGLSGVKKITSNALDGFAVVMVEFTFEKNLQEATQEIRDKLNAIRNDLPVEMK
jgi:HAE1 family hydrophobic/amphiphilic exporter-1